MEELIMSPNPRQALDRNYSIDELRGADLFLNRPVQDGNSCADCHQLPLGTINEIVETFRGGEAPSIVVPQLRGLYNKLSPAFLPGGGVGKRTELGAGLNHSGVAATIQDVALESDETGSQLFNITPQQANQVADFIEGLDTGLAPSTAFQFTAHSGNLASVQVEELPFLLQQADQGHCEVVFMVRATSASALLPYMTGMYNSSTGGFLQASATLPELTVADLLANAQQGRPVTFMGVANLRGKVMGLDRDNDDLFDLDEFQQGTDPENMDTDADGLPDGYEVLWSTDPLVPNGNPSDNVAPSIIDGPHVIYGTQTSIKVEFETDEVVRTLFFVDGTAVFRRPLDQEFDNKFSYSIGGLTAQTNHTIGLLITDPAGNASTVNFQHQTADLVRPRPVHVVGIGTSVQFAQPGASTDVLRVGVDLGDGQTPALSGYEVDIAVYYVSPQELVSVTSSQLALSTVGGSIRFDVPIPASIPSGQGEFLVVINDVSPPTGFPSYVEANNAVNSATQSY